MLPIFLLEGSQFAFFLHQQMLTSHPTVHARAEALVERFIPSALGVVGWQQLSTSSKWNEFNQKVVLLSATCEVIQGLMLIIELVFPTRNFLFTFMWWQFLQMRYMLDQSGNIKRTFAAVDQRIMPLVSNKLCPEIIRGGYDKLKGLLAKQVQLPAAGEAPPSMFSKCSIS